MLPKTHLFAQTITTTYYSHPPSDCLRLRFSL